MTLYYCIQSLGFRLGWRYWRLANKARVNPWLALDWAARCDAEAVRLAQVNPALATASREWAQCLRTAFISYTNHDLLRNSTPRG